MASSFLVDTISFSQEWKIENFRDIFSTERSFWISGPTMNLTQDCSLQLKLQKLDQSKFQFFLENTGKVDVTINERTLDIDNIFIYALNEPVNLKVGYRFSPSRSKEDFKNWVKMRPDAFVDGAVTVKLDIANLELANPDKPAKALQPDQPVSELARDFSKVLTDPIFSDWSLICDGETIRCHRIFLGSRSRFFRRIFEQSEFSEDNSRETELKNIDLVTLKRLLKYIYTDVVDLNKGSVVKLFAAADEFDIPALRQKCETHIGANLNVDNVVDNLQLSILHNSLRLKQDCFHFMAKNFAEVKTTKAWFDLKSEYYSKSILEDIIQYMSSYMVCWMCSKNIE